jgi:hypothetical protein
LFDREVDDFFGIRVLENPVVQNVLDRVSPVFFGSCFGLMAVVELESAARKEDETYVPGNRGFDPLGLFPKSVDMQQKMMSAEITHGRVAMMAMGIYLLQEYDFSTSDSSFLVNALVTAVEQW